MNDVLINKELLEDVLDDLYDYRGGKSWWKDEPRCNFIQYYNELSKRIEKLEEILKNEN